MAEASNSVTDDIAVLTSWLDDPEALAAWMDDTPYIHTLDEARRDIAKLLVGLEDIRAGRVVPHDVVRRDVEERRRRLRPDAAE